MKKPMPITSEEAPKAIGPYSQAVLCDGFVFASGQIPLDPKTGEMNQGDFPTQVHQVCRNLTAVLAKAGCSCEDVVKTTVFLTSMDHFPALNEVYFQYFGKTKPARSTIAVAALPKASLVEIECIARVPLNLS